MIPEFRQGPAGQFFSSASFLGSLSSVQLVAGLVWKMHKGIMLCLMPLAPPDVPSLSPHAQLELTSGKEQKFGRWDVLKQMVCQILAYSQWEF